MADIEIGAGITIGGGVSFGGSGGGGGPVTYTEGVNYSAGGVVRSGVGSGTSITIDSAYWNNISEFNFVLGYGSGTAFTIVQGGVSQTVNAYTSWTMNSPGNYTITGAGSQYTPGGNQSSISFTP